MIDEAGLVGRLDLVSVLVACELRRKVNRVLPVLCRAGDMEGVGV